MMNKKSITTNFLILLIISIITLLLLINYFSNYLESSNYSTSNLECSYLFSNIDGKSSFFDENLKNPNANLINLISNSCPSKSIKIKENSIDKAAKLIEDCFFKTGQGTNFFAVNSKGSKLCLYCGEIEFEEDIDNFGTKLYEKLRENNKIFSNELESNNLNIKFLKELLEKEKISKYEILSIIYFSYIPELENKILLDNSDNDFNNIDNADNLLEKTNQYIFDLENDFSNVLINSNYKYLKILGSFNKELNKNFMSLEKPFFAITLSRKEKINSIDKLDFNSNENLEKKLYGENIINCDILVIPNKNFD